MTDLTGTQKNIKEYYEELYVNILNNLNAIDVSPEKSQTHKTADARKNRQSK